MKTPLITQVEDIIAEGKTASSSRLNILFMEANNFPKQSSASRGHTRNGP